MSIISWTSPRRLGPDLAGLDRDQVGQRLLVLAQQFAQLAHERAADGRGHGAPLEVGVVGASPMISATSRRVGRDAGEHAAGDRRADLEVAVDRAVRAPSAG